MMLSKKNVRGFVEDVARALVADGQLVLGSEPVKDREANTHEGDA